MRPGGFNSEPARALVERSRQCRRATALACEQAATAHERCAAAYEQMALRTSDERRLEELLDHAARERVRAAHARERGRLLTGETFDLSARTGSGGERLDP